MKKLLFVLAISTVFVSCSTSTKPARKVSTEPTEKIIRDHKWGDFSIVLDDMRIEDEPDFMVYQHKYKILTLQEDSLHVKKTPWRTVNKKYFKDHENDLGMEVASKHNGKLSRITQPVGFGWAIGNEKHGDWEEVKKDSTLTSSSHNSHRRWRTSGTSPFFWYWLGTRRSTYRNDYNRYQSNYNAGRSYYGNTNGNYTYGTRSNYQRTNRSSFFSRKTKNASRWNSLTNRNSRSSSRYSNGSSTRSRSGGFGK
ncbi:MAG: hypothetical protein ACPGU6_00695 [Tenacibaculum sp.]